VGELDIATSPELEAMIAALCGEEANEIILDLSELSFVDSTGLRALLLSKERCEADRCELSVARAQGQVQQLFDLTGLTDALLFREAR
jgi:anti-anti-sigma factor